MDNVYNQQRKIEKVAMYSGNTLFQMPQDEEVEV